MAMEVEGKQNSATVAQQLLLSIPPLPPLGRLRLWVEAVASEIRSVVLVPALRVMVVLCLVMSVMLIIEKLSMGAVSLAVKLRRRKPEKVYKWEPMVRDEELGSLAYPMVLVQVPMYNEREVYQLSIGAACSLSWPPDRMIVQVLDDSTDPEIKDLVEKECKKWAEKGQNIKYERRDNRNGYKAGALKEGMKHIYVGTCDYVAVFDADFQPEPDFLLRMIPFLIHNSDVALVQARWKFVNADECLLTRIQEMSLDYHFKVEQESGSSTHAFFGFNGTAGIWRINAIKEAGGWKDRTTVEDMDLAVRAGLGGWKFVYVGDVKVKSELPSTFKAYRYQQHRWSCGPANLFRKMTMEIIRNRKVSISQKFYVIYNFFITRRIVAHIVTFFFYCVVIPTSVFFAEVDIPLWGVVYIPTTITLLSSVGTPSSLHLIVFWVLFENVMAMNRTKAVIIGLLEAGSANEWVVTEKLGEMLQKKADEKDAIDKESAKEWLLTDKVVDAVNTQKVETAAKKHQSKIFNRLHLLEIVVGIYLGVCAFYDVLYGHDYYYTYIFPQSLTFLIMGFGCVGTFVPNAK